jgi:3-hydroxyisobutyrate dehydrogenase-like beta-hydroxyacid dehydrogenase
MEGKVTTQKIGFIGLGEVGRTFAQAMKTRGAVVYYFNGKDKDPEEGIVSLPFQDLFRKCDVILSTVPNHVAEEVAEKATPCLNSEKTYADMNSTSASVKKRIAQIIEPSHASFIEGAILSAVGEMGPKASILVSGEKAEEFSKLMNQLGLPNVKYFSPRIGEASQVKMIRSVFSKGVECLLLEMLIAGKRAGITDYLWKDIVDFMTKNSFEKVAENWIKTHPKACERRYHEMVQVIGTLEEMDIDPVMTRGTRDFLERSWRMGLRQRFLTKPECFWDVPSRLEEELKKA